MAEREVIGFNAQRVSHYAVILFSGDPASEHPDEELCGRSPHLSLIAVGSHDRCWEALAAWTDKHPLRMWEDAEVLARDLTLIEARMVTRNAR